ncbi:type II secretion system protein GspJ [Pseudohongiella nitratireducens]|uniref:Type II secretion system protein J n=1 Tax=Pseudohongiella nitratireducens TaxID=1768907 RepID=A0A916QM43_9GAMM|nr:type II secretion system protein GspJ [Pseudohongiella nitratireducens]MDF1623328.1 type II secretion system protein GspJ [Pseudohongiella nitratireducens]GFZ78186.1 type II secretion system protein GspJ [Pseudohongiella nitratireducens]
MSSRMVRTADQRGSQGFTLIELLIAMSLTALIGVLAVRFLGAAMDAEARSATLLEDVNAVEQVWQLLASDLEQIAMHTLNQPAVGNDVFAALVSEQSSPALVGGPGRRAVLDQATGLTGGLLLFNRHGWDNPLQEARSEVQRVLYRLADNTLIRDYWQENNQRYSAPPEGSLHLLSSVRDIEIQFLPALPDGNSALNWRSDWPAADMSTVTKSDQDSVSEEEAGDAPQILDARPRAVAITLETEALGRVQRLFALPGI